MQTPNDQKLRAEVARTLRELRESAGLTQADIAVRLGTQQSFVSKYEAAERRLDIGEVYAICRAIGTPFESAIALLSQRWETPDEGH